MSGPSNYQPKSAFGKWMHERLPIMELVQGQALDFPTPKNLNYWWTFGGILAVLCALAVHLFITLPLVLKLICRVSPLRHFHAMAPALLAIRAASDTKTARFRARVMVAYVYFCLKA